MVNETTLVRIKYSTKGNLEKIGKKGDTFDVLISELIKYYKLNRKKVNFYNISQKIIQSHWILCRYCNKKRAAHIHHIDKNRKNNSLENMEYLCVECHRNIFHTNKGKMAIKYKDKVLTKKAKDRWQKIIKK